MSKYCNRSPAGAGEYDKRRNWARRLQLQAMGVTVVHGALYNMVKQLFAQRLQQRVLCLKVGVKCASADVGPVDDLLHRDAAVILTVQQRGKSLEDRCPGFLLSPVHKLSFHPSCYCVFSCTFFRTLFQKCPVADNLLILIVVFPLKSYYNNYRTNYSVIDKLYCIFDKMSNRRYLS